MALINDVVMNEKGEQVLPTINIPSYTESKGGYWAGMSAGEFKAIYKSLHAVGTLSSANYIVELEPYSKDSMIAEIGIFDAEFAWIPWLATSCTLPLIEAQVDNVQAGHYQQNYITSNALGDISMSILETLNGDILNAVSQIKEIMFNGDGTQGLPFDYLMWLNVSLYPRHNRTIVPFTERILVALQASSLDLAANNPNPIELPLTFTRMYPMFA